MTPDQTPPERSPGTDPGTGDRRYQRLLNENFALREKVRSLEEDIEALRWDIRLRRIRSPWGEIRPMSRRVGRHLRRSLSRLRLHRSR